MCADNEGSYQFLHAIQILIGRIESNVFTIFTLFALIGPF